MWFDITGTNPFRDTRSNDFKVRSLIYEGLTGVTKELEVVPSLAESWEMTPDGLSYTFRIRQGVRFHTGKDLAPEDVKWSLEYILDPKNRAYGHAPLSVIRSIVAVDPRTVQITLKQPAAAFLAALGPNKAPITPARTVFLPGELPAGTGPFQFVAWKSEDHLLVRRFPGYWVKGVPYLEEVLIRPIPDENVRFTALRSGSLDVIENAPSREAQAILKGDLKGFSVVVAEAAGLKRLRFNTRRPPLDQVKVRQALSLAIDKEEILKGASWGFGEVIN
jgi:peptide/nickel transport system substrate-binding protein